MGEALLIKAGGGSSGSSANSSQNGLITEIFMTNTVWKVPQNLRNGIVSVRLFGGGAAGWYSGGCGGHMSNAQINLWENNETDIWIMIGAGGTAVNNGTLHGGTTSFGTYLSALGANETSGGAAGGLAHTLGQYNVIATYGGGGGGAGYMTGNSLSSSSSESNGSMTYSTGTNGGTYGGGGGSVSTGNISRGGCNNGNSSSRTGYAGNGGNKSTTAKNGTNTIGMGLDFEGAGIAGNAVTINNCTAGGGGGGYGGNGGHGYVYTYENSSNGKYMDAGAGGGGGGYGANGGNGWAYANSTSTMYAGGGGGGGYGGDGGDGGINSGGGGGGYGKCGKGGSYTNTNGTAIFTPAGIAAGGLGNISNKAAINGGSGICILQYYLD